MNAPICIIGAARSGTTMLGDILQQHPDVAYWIEPKYIWRYGNPRAESDIRGVDEATPAITRYIRRKFTVYTERRGKARFMEKTPSNCFRIPFIDRVLPNALYLDLVRDGRDVAFSAQRKWTSPTERGALQRRLTSWEVPLRDAPFYLADTVRDVLGRTLFPRKGYIWGPVFPGLPEVRRAHSVLETCALQWQESVRAVRAGFQSVDPERRLTFKFEELVAAPQQWLETILDFLGLGRNAAVLQYADRFVDQRIAGRWRRADPEDVAAIEALIGDTLEEFGYPCGSASAQDLTEGG